MKIWIVIFCIIIVFLICSLFYYKESSLFKYSLNTENNMILKSNSFKNNNEIPSVYTCDGKNISPDLHIYNVPKNTKELALIADDPDALSRTWTHWTVWNIPSNVKKIEEGRVPKGSLQGLTSFGSVGYGGPCPPAGSGIHRYFFRIYALKNNINLDNGSTVKELKEKIADNIIDSAEIVGLYGNNN